MAFSLYEMSVPSFQRSLNALLAILDKAEAHAAARKFDPVNYLGLRLAPDQFTFLRQVQSCCDHAKNAASRLSGVEPPFMEDKETIWRNCAYASARRSTSSRRSTQIRSTRPTDARSCFRSVRTARSACRRIDTSPHFALPNFYFHLTSAYDILRAAGVEIGKRDFLGAIPDVARGLTLRTLTKMSIKRLHPGPRMSQAVIHGDTIYLAGQVAEQAKGKSVADQTKEILATIDKLLAEAGSDKTKLLSATIYLADIATFAEMNGVWDFVGPGRRSPARATVEAKLAAPPYTVEIACIAAKA